MPSENPSNDFTPEIFDQEVTRSEQPVMIDFWAPWCQPCQMMMPLIEQAAAEYGDRVKFIKVNISDNETAAQRLNIMGVPTLITFVRGQEQERAVGLQTLERIKSMLDKLSAS